MEAWGPLVLEVMGRRRTARDERTLGARVRLYDRLANGHHRELHREQVAEGAPHLGREVVVDGLRTLPPEAQAELVARVCASTGRVGLRGSGWSHRVVDSADLGDLGDLGARRSGWCGGAGVPPEFGKRADAQPARSEAAQMAYESGQSGA